MIGPITDRATFRALSQRSHRANVPGLVVRARYRADNEPDREPRSDASVNEHIRVSYAISRRVGTAVARNRLRRRLRAIIDAYHVGPHGPMLDGDYLFAAQPGLAEVPFAELSDRVTRVINDLAARQPHDEVSR